MWKPHVSKRWDLIENKIYWDLIEKLLRTLDWARCVFLKNYWFLKWNLLGRKPKLASRIDLLLNKIKFEGSHIKLPTKVSSLDFYRLGLPKLPLKIRKIYLVRTCLVTVNPTTTTWGITLTPVSIKYRRGICSRPWFFD